MHLDIVFKTFVGVLAAIVMVGSGVGVTVGFSRAVAADNYMESISKVIVESNYNEAVIRECQEEAEENGYILEVDVQNASKAGVKYYAKIKLTYYFEIELFGLKQQKIQTKII
ncbi:MAG: hypothetical protein IJA07_08265 [Agathobacter sp.]|nr:hypothetical protein [Agathobacter sp.]